MRREFEFALELWRMRRAHPSMAILRGVQWYVCRVCKPDPAYGGTCVYGLGRDRKGRWVALEALAHHHDWTGRCSIHVVFTPTAREAVYEGLTNGALDALGIPRMPIRK